ncbi:hypothetical protein [Levilactobacillus yiduensis]|nr:hypothetical protein [Levilactobacillus yiduensis]
MYLLRFEPQFKKDYQLLKKSHPEFVSELRQVRIGTHQELFHGELK